MALALNNLQRLICHLTKKLNHYLAFFVMFFCSHILLPYCTAPYASCIWFVLEYSHPTYWLNFFSLLRKVLFCSYYLTLFRCFFIFSLLSLISFTLSLQTVLWNLSAVLFLSFHPNVSLYVLLLWYFHLS